MSKRADYTVNVQNNNGTRISLQGERFADVTKSDVTTFEESTIFVGTAGNVSVKNSDGDTVVFKNIANGSFLPILVTQVLDATTAADIIRIY